jgi:hypothetical protein
MNTRVYSCRTLVVASSLLFTQLVPLGMAQANVNGQWSALSTTMPVNPVHAALLSNGQVLVIGGSGNCPPSLSGCPSGPPYGASNGSGAALWDPVSGQTVAQFSLSWDMFCNGMALLQDGRALIDGGTIQYDPFYGQPQVAIFDPATNTFSNTQNMADGRWYPTVVTLGDGRVMAFSGLGETGHTNSSVEFYTVGSGWSTQYFASWTPDLYPRLHLLPNGTVFYSGAQTTSKLFDPSTMTWNTNVATTNYSGRRTYGTSVLLPLTPANNYDPMVMIMGGGSPATPTSEIIDMGAAMPAWVSGLNMSQARIEMNAVILPSGQVLALGGSVNDEDTSSLSTNADLFDVSTVNLNNVPPSLGTVSSAGVNASERLYHSVALLLPDATVWLAGGNPVRGTYNSTMEIYQPAYLFNADGTLATRPSITGAPGSIPYGSAFTLQTPDAANISQAVLVRNGTVTHAFGMDQRLVGMSFTAGSGSLTITAPPNGNIAPPGYYMLFILNTSGVPSVAQMVQLGQTVMLSPSSLSFGTQLFGTSSASQPVTLTNIAAASLNITNIAASGNFSQTNNCGSSVPPNGQCTINVSFAPHVRGTLTGAVTIADNAPTSPQTVPLTGVGTVVTLLPSSLNLGNQQVGTTSQPQVATLTNYGKAAVSIQHVHFTGTNPGAFAQSNNCGASVPVGGSCSINVTFTPKSKGPKSAILDVNDNGGGSPQKVTLSGTGT